MKKLMTVLAATAMSFGLFADTVETTANLHGFEVDEDVDVMKIDAPLNLDAEIDGSKVWDAGETNPTLVKAYKDSEALDAEAGNSYLGIETDGTPLFRGFANSDGDAVNFGDVYVNTYVQFTAADSEPTNIGKDDKIALWLQEDEVAGTTNLMVACGKIDIDGNVTSESVALDADIEPNSWHKVTIKPQLDPEGGAFFLVYLDGTALTVAGTYDLVADETVFTAANQALITAKQLLPSRIAFGSVTGSDTLAGIAFDGTGAIDNLDITTDEPFPPTYAIAKADTTGGSFTVTDEAGKEITAALAGATVTVTATPADESYELDTITVTDAEGGTVDVVIVKNVGTFEMPAKAVTVEVAFKQVQTDPIPPLPVDPQPGDVQALVLKIGFKDAGVVELIGDDAATYSAFKTWASETIGNEQAVVDSEHSADSFQLGLEELLENDPVSEIKTIAKDGDTVTFTFEIKDGEKGEAVAANAVDYVKTLVKCNEKVDFGTATEIKDATVDVTIVETTLTATVVLPEGKESAFMKVAK